MQNRSHPPVAALTALLLAGLAACSSSPKALPSGILRIRTAAHTVTVRVELAETEAARETGLMDRESLDQDAGMAFLYARPTTGSYWMKDTLIPLSIAFWDENGRIVAMLDMAPCRADPCPQYDPHRTYVGALEVNRGFFADHGVALQDAVTLAGRSPGSSEP